MKTKSFFMSIIFSFVLLILGYADVQAKLKAPDNLTATAVSSSQINLTWQSKSPNETGFKIERAASSSGPWTQIATVGANITTYSNTGLTPSTTYYYRVCAYDTAGNSSYSNTASATTQSGGTVPITPSNLTASAISSSQINLTWQDNSTNETGFRIERAASSGGPWTQIATAAANATSYSNTSLNPSTTYYYRVCAYNTAGNSTYLNTASATTLSSGEWSRSFGSPGEDRGQSVAVDGSGGVVVTGSFSGTVDFGGGPLTSAHYPWLDENNYRDIFLAKYAASGEHLWSRRFGDVADDYGRSVVVDGSDDVIVAGSCGNSVDFGNGYPTSTFGGRDAFVAKYSGVNGSYLWARRFGGIYDDDAYGVAVDGNGNVFVTGQFMDTVNFGGGSLNSAGLQDIFIVKYSASGAHLWSKRLGGVDSEYGYGIAVDTNGDVIVTGRFSCTVDLGGGTLTSAGAYDIFLAKYSGVNGAHVWSKRLGSTGYDYANDIAVDSNGNVMVTGQFQGTVDFGGGPLISAGSYDIFVAKYAGSNGSHLWSKRFGSTSSDNSCGVAVDGNNNVILTGAFQGAVDFGGGPLINAGAYDIFLAKYTASGAHVWSENFGGTINQLGTAVAVNGSSNVAVTGYFENIVDFGGGIHTSAGGYDIFLTSLMP